MSFLCRAAPCALGRSLLGPGKLAGAWGRGAGEGEGEGGKGRQRSLSCLGSPRSRSLYLVLPGK